MANTNKYFLSVLEKSRSRIKVEETNLELKRQWWNLKTSLDEFLKDTCSMANTHSGDSYIIIGLEEDGTLCNAPLPEDEASLQAKHKDKIEPKIQVEFSESNIDGKTISIIKIPHSGNRPHIIKKYKAQENWIPVRFGTATLTASRADLDEMYHERDKGFTPNVSAELSQGKEELVWDNFAGYRGCCFATILTIDNYRGLASDYITNVTLKENSGDYWESKHFLFEDTHQLDGILEIKAREVKEDVRVYISDQEPSGLGDRRKMPNIDRDTITLNLATRSGNIIIIPVKPAWIREG